MQVPTLPDLPVERPNRSPGTPQLGHLSQPGPDQEKAGYVSTPESSFQESEPFVDVGTEPAIRITSAHLNYASMDNLIDYFNSKVDGIKLMYSTPAIRPEKEGPDHSKSGSTPTNHSSISLEWFV